MDIKELKYILTIAQEGSISRAAEKLYMAQSSLSEYLSRMESELNTKLFVRSTSGVRPTLAGDVYLKSASEIYKQLERTEQEVRNIDYVKGGRIILGVSTFRGAYLLPQVLCEFYQRNPQVEVIIQEHDSKELIRLTSRGDLDIALIAEVEEDDSLIYESIMKEEVFILAEKNHPILQSAKLCESCAEQLYVMADDAANYEFLLSNPKTILGIISEKLFGSNLQFKKNPNKNLSAYFATALAKKGLGLALTYGECTGIDKDIVYLRINPEGYFVNLKLIYPTEKYRNRAVLELASLIRNYFCVDM